MHRILTCLTVEHDYRLVLLAGLLCAVAAFATFNIYSRVAASEGLRRAALLLLTGVCSASGIWATHFIAMLAYDIGFPIAYEPVTTAASYVVAVVATTFGFAISANGRNWEPWLGGAVIGAGIGLTHFTGMRALIIPGALQWDTTLVLVSLAIGVALASAAMILFHKASARSACWIAAGLFLLAVFGLHFTAMDAATIVPDPTIAVTPSPFDDALMAAAVTGATLVIMLSGIAAVALMENQMRRRQEEELRVQNLRFDMALANMGEGLCMFDAQKRLVVCNDRYARMYHLPPELLKTGTRHHDIIKHRILHGVLKGEQDDAAADRMIATLSALPTEAPSTRIDELADGRLVCVTRQPMAGGGWVATHLDVTERQRTEARITYMAHHDALTDLPNRVLLREWLDKALAGARRGSRRLAVLMLDLDRFKEINDTLGHQVGDALLKAVADRLRGCIRETALIARLGGDEFAIIDDVIDPFGDATALAGRIQAALSKPFDLGDHQARTRTSIGIAILPGNGNDPDEVLKNADLALYRAKNCGRGTHRFFEPEMDRLMQARRDLERDLRNALARGEFRLHYQPSVNLRSGEICGCEALLRWQHPKRGLLLPAEFISLAEETGLIAPIGEWVLWTACQEAAGWLDKLTISVNLSPAQFRGGELQGAIVRALGASGLAPQRLELEVTEAVMMQDREVAFATLRRLHELGVRVTLDDFGSGYSSLDFLQNFPFDKIKIDRGFISQLSAAKKEARVIARAVLRFAVSLGRITAAEGVETKEQLDILQAEGCTEMQGYYFSAPKCAAEIERLLAAPVKTAASAA